VEIGDGGEDSRSVQVNCDVLLDYEDPRARRGEGSVFMPCGGSLVGTECSSGHFASSLRLSFKLSWT
jgi:hypothetical protein